MLIVLGAFFVLLACGVVRLLGPDWGPGSTSVRLSARLTQESYRHVLSKKAVKRERLKGVALIVLLVAAVVLLTWLLGGFE